MNETLILNKLEQLERSMNMEFTALLIWLGIILLYIWLRTDNIITRLKKLEKRRECRNDRHGLD